MKFGFMILNSLIFLVFISCSTVTDETKICVTALDCLNNQICVDGVCVFEDGDKGDAGDTGNISDTDNVENTDDSGNTGDIDVIIHDDGDSGNTGDIDAVVPDNGDTGNTGDIDTVVPDNGDTGNTGDIDAVIPDDDDTGNTGDIDIVPDDSGDTGNTGTDADTAGDTGVLFANGGFELWTDPAYPDSWKGTKTDFAAANIIKESTKIHSGSFAVKLQNTTTNHKRFTSAAIALTAGDYTCKYWASGSGKVRNAFYSNDVASDYAYTAYKTIASASWTEITYTFKLTTDRAAFELIFSVQSTSTTNDHLKIDDVVCTKD
ncbi:MAG TPA: hypothetical protein PKG52_04835 [bacterium]|nr:hypothetical protein [bacterium]HPS31647.1 hypothetical protein [bacterium]